MPKSGCIKTRVIKMINEIKVIDLHGNELATYSVGKFPGDFAIWNQDNN